MKEKNAIKISLPTILLIIAIIVILIMSYFIYILNNAKKIEIQKSAELQSQVTNLTKTVNNLQGKLNSISETINSNNNNSLATLSEADALKILKSKFDILEKIYFSSSSFFNVDTTEEIKNFDNAILEYGTDNLLKEIKSNLPMLIKFENGKYYFFEGGGARQYVEFGSFENIKVTDSSITATLKTKQSMFNGTDWVPTDDKSSEFTLVKDGNEWLIDHFDSTNFN